MTCDMDWRVTHLLGLECRLTIKQVALLLQTGRTAYVRHIDVIVGDIQGVTSYWNTSQGVR